MYFEAESKGKKYKIDVTELRFNWKISIQEENKDWVHHDISKSDYKEAEQYISFLFKGSSYLIDVIGKDTDYTVFTRNSFRTIKIYNDEMILHESLKKGGNFGGDSDLRAGMPGKVIEIFVKVGDTVKANKPLLIMEAMKMEYTLKSEIQSTVVSLKVEVGSQVKLGQLLVELKQETK